MGLLLALMNIIPEILDWRQEERARKEAAAQANEIAEMINQVLGD